LKELCQNFPDEIKKLNNDYGDDVNDVNNNNICQGNGLYGSVNRIVSENHLVAAVPLPDLEHILTSLENFTVPFRFCCYWSKFHLHLNILILLTSCEVPSSVSTKYL
jgi:hypothetical protein